MATSKLSTTGRQLAETAADSVRRRRHRRGNNQVFLLAAGALVAVLAVRRTLHKSGRTSTAAIERQQREHEVAVLRRSARRARHTARVARKLATGRAHGMIHRANVALIGHKAPSDPQLEQRVRSILFRDALMPKREITVHAHDGTVTLTGTVRSGRVAREIERRTRDIADVTHVNNDIVVENRTTHHARA